MSWSFLTFTTSVMLRVTLESFDSWPESVSCNSSNCTSTLPAGIAAAGPRFVTLKFVIVTPETVGLMTASVEPGGNVFVEQSAELPRSILDPFSR